MHANFFLMFFCFKVPSSSGPLWCGPSPPAEKFICALQNPKNYWVCYCWWRLYPGRRVRVWSAGLLDMTRHADWIWRSDDLDFHIWAICNPILFALFNGKFQNSMNFAFWEHCIVFGGKWIVSNQSEKQIDINKEVEVQTSEKKPHLRWMKHLGDIKG